LKYLVLRTPNGEAPVLFPRAFMHAHVAQLFKPLEVVSAGFVSNDDGALQCHGASVGLHIASRPLIDSVLLDEALKDDLATPPLPLSTDPPPPSHDR
jgi:hypothetical protein